jgi:hypothetical protein
LRRQSALGDAEFVSILPEIGWFRRKIMKNLGKSTLDRESPGTDQWNGCLEQSEALKILFCWKNTVGTWDIASGLLSPALRNQNMQKPSHHIFVCGSFRMNGTPQGVHDPWIGGNGGVAKFR